jgi:hypothetical protein
MIDNQVELWPINIGWPNFTVNNLRYRNSDLTIVWDDPADGVTRYPGVPQGYSVYVNGNRAFTVDRLVRTVWNPATGAVTFPGGTGTVLFNTAVSGMQAPEQVNQNSARMVDMFAKAGVDLTSTLPDLAQGATTSASFTASGTSTGRRWTASPSTTRSGCGRLAEQPGLVRAQLRPGADRGRGTPVLPRRPAGRKRLPGTLGVPDPGLERQHLDDRERAGEDARGAAGQLQQRPLPGGERAAAAGPGHQPVGRQDRPDGSQGVQPGWLAAAGVDEPGAVRHAERVVHLALGVGRYPLATNQYNHVTFTGVTTTQLRVLLQCGQGSVGLLEVKALR